MSEQIQNYQGFMGYTWAHRLAESRFLRGKSVPFPRMMTAFSMLFQTGAVLGRARGDRGADLAELFAQPGQGQRLTTGFGEIGEGLRGEIDPAARSPLLDLAMRQLASSVGIEGGMAELMEDADQRVSVETAAQVLGGALTLGTALGFSSPDLVEQFWRKEHESSEQDDALDAALLEVARGEVHPTKGEPMRLEEFEHQVLADLSVFVRTYYPELLEVLGLETYGPEELRS